MSLSVAATPPDGRFRGVAHATSEEDLSGLIDEFQRRGQGYLEIHDGAADWPVLAVGISGTVAVIHLFETGDSVSLLQGTAATAEAVDVPIQDELATFDGIFAVPLDTARDVVHQFARGSLPDSLVWHRL